METLKKYEVSIKSMSPLIMHSDRLCNPLDSMTKELKAISGIRKKQDEHYMAMAKIEWTGSLYFDEEIGIYLPAKCLKGCIQAAARKFKLGRATKAVTIDRMPGVPLSPFEGYTVEKLWNAKNKKGEQIHVFTNSVVVGQARIMRTLPIFPQWEAKFDMYLNIELLSFDQFTQILDVAGFEMGLCELRPESASGTYGRFRVESITEI